MENGKIDTVIYEATITTPTETKKYIGSTEGSFKQRFYGHTTDTKHNKNKNNTSLALFYWENMEEGIQPTIKWKILKKMSQIQTRRKEMRRLHNREIISTKKPRTRPS